MTTSDSLSAVDRMVPVALAAAWPLGLLAQIPGTPLFLGPCLAAACCLLALVVAFRNRGCRPPFEYAFPALLLAASTLLPGRGNLGVSPLAGAGVFIAANILVRSRYDAVYALATFSVSCGLVAIGNFLASHGLLPPAGIEPATRTALAGAASIPDQVLLLLGGVLAGVAVLARPDSTRFFRSLLVIATLASGAWLLRLAPAAGTYLSEGTHVGFSDILRLENIAPLLLLWLVARVTARALLRPAHADAPKPWLLPALVLVAVSAHLVLGRMPAPSVLFLLGLAAAHDAPWSDAKGDEFPRWGASGCVVALAVCLFAQIAGLAPFTVADPRNHVAISEELLREKNWETLDARLAFLLKLQPGRTDLVVLSARSLLRQGRPEAAVDRFCEALPSSLRSEKNTTTQFSPERAFLDELRDATSALPIASRGLLFERALIKAGQDDAALNAMNIRRESLEAGPEFDAAQLRKAVAQLLGSQEFALRLDDWSGPDLSGLLETGGIHVEALPTDFSADRHPLVVRALRIPEGLRIDVWRGPFGAPERIVVPESAPAPRDVAAPNPQEYLHWGVWRQSGAGAWLLPLAGIDGPLGELDPTSPAIFEFARGTLPRGEYCATTVYLP